MLNSSLWKMTSRCRVINLVVIFLLMLIISGCSSSSGILGGSSKDEQSLPAAPRESSSTQNPASQSETIPRKMAEMWKYEIEVADARQANANIIAKADQLQGYLTESRMSDDKDEIKASLVVKVPESSAQLMVEYLQSIGYVKDEEKTSRDVSDTYYDTEARLKVLTAEEERLLGYMQTKTSTIQDLLAVEKEIARVRQERESLQARMNVLKNQVDYTSFSITLSENQTALKAPKGTLGKAGQGFMSSLGALVKLLTGLFIIFISSLPFLAVFGGIFYLVIRWIRRRKAKKSKSLQEAAPIYAPGYKPEDNDSGDTSE